VARLFELNGNYVVYFQMTPSICCEHEHGGQWFWMLFGMAAFYAFANDFIFDADRWRNFLQTGYAKKNLFEIFPRATIQYLRKQGHEDDIRRIIDTLQTSN